MSRVPTDAQWDRATKLIGWHHRQVFDHEGNGTSRTVWVLSEPWRDVFVAEVRDSRPVLTLTPLAGWFDRCGFQLRLVFIAGGWAAEAAPNEIARTALGAHYGTPGVYDAPSPEVAAVLLMNAIADDVNRLGLDQP